MRNQQADPTEPTAASLASKFYPSCVLPHRSRSPPRSRRVEDTNYRRQQSPPAQEISSRVVRGRDGQDGPVKGKVDAKFHVGGGSVMTYRVVSRAISKPDHGGSDLEATDALGISQEAMGWSVTRQETFLLIVVPDLFMTLDSMEESVGGMLDQNSRGTLLLVRDDDCQLRTSYFIEVIYEALLPGNLSDVGNSEATYTPIPW